MARLTGIRFSFHIQMKIVRSLDFHIYLSNFNKSIINKMIKCVTANFQADINGHFLRSHELTFHKVKKKSDILMDVTVDQIRCGTTMGN